MVQNRTHLKAVTKADITKLSSGPKSLIDHLQALDDMRQDLFELFENVEILEEEIKQALYAEQSSKRK